MSIMDLITESPPETGKANGVTVGVVTSIEDPDKLGRVKVKMTNRSGSSDETGFIRVCTPMAGKQWGMFFFPEVGDEVLLAFAEGDITRPYVIGFLWSGEYKPPIEIKDGKNENRVIKTKNGHELIFHDEGDKDRIELKTPGSRSIKIDDEKEVTVITDKNGSNLIKLDTKNGVITIEAENKIQINAGTSKITLDGKSNSIIMESSQSLTVKSSQITIEAKSTLDLKSSGAVNVNASGPASVKGAVVKLN